jgi:hypothetical protein
MEQINNFTLMEFLKILTNNKLNFLDQMFSIISIMLTKITISMMMNTQKISKI